MRSFINVYASDSEFMARGRDKLPAAVSLRYISTNVSRFVLCAVCVFFFWLRCDISKTFHCFLLSLHAN